MFAITVYVVFMCEGEGKAYNHAIFFSCFVFLLLAAAAYAVKRCPGKEDNTVYVSGFF